MHRLVPLFRSSVGKKVLMALSGAILFVFIIGHLEGNLKVYEGPAAYDAYAAGLRTVGAPFFGHGQALWVMRAVLFVALVVHVTMAIQLTLMARRARPDHYQQTPHLEETYSSRTMRWGGVIILLFVVYHLLHLTWGTVHPDFVPGSVYHNVVTGFRVWPVSAAYILALLALGVHLHHGLYSALQTLGANHPQYNRWRRTGAAVVAIVITAGFISIPVSVLTGVLR